MLSVLVLKQMTVNPINNYLSKVFARHWEQRHPSVVVAVLAITLPFPEKDNKAPLPVSWDNACVPGRAQTCMQWHGTAFPPALRSSTWMPQIPGALPPFQPVHRILCFHKRRGSQLIGGSAIGIVTPLTSNSTTSQIVSCITKFPCIHHSFKAKPFFFLSMKTWIRFQYVQSMAVMEYSFNYVEHYQLMDDFVKKFVSVHNII